MSYENVLLTMVVLLAFVVVAMFFLREDARARLLGGSTSDKQSTPPEEVHSHSDGRDGVTILHGRPRLTEAYKELRTRDDLNRVLAVWSADYGEIEKYFAEEMDWLKRNPDVTVERVVVAQDHQRAFLAKLASKHHNLRLYTSTTKDFEFELYICEYTHPDDLESRAGILVVNNMLSRRPEFGIMIDAQAAPQLGPFVSTLRTWFDKLPRRAVEGRSGDDDVWTQIAAHYDEHVSRDSPVPFLRQFIRAEDDYVIGLIQNAPTDVTLVEFGSGTGRTIHYLRSHPEIPEKVVYFIGFDHSDGMIRESRTKRANSPGVSSGRTFFFTLDGATAFENFWGGHLLLTENLGDVDHLKANPFDAATYESSDKIFCCLLNTLGVLDQSTRAQFVANLFVAASDADTVVVSVFDREAFEEYAPKLYSAIEPLVGASKEDDYKFDDADAEFRAGNYFSHWFGEAELNELVEAGGGRVHSLHPILMEDGTRIGHIATCKKTGRGSTRIAA